uniref:Ground-like domain-containing protein n=1 Tax=Caenorhabditis japonica TaxID=281687 RepID=A0A8R1HJ46_CAEJA
MLAALILLQLLIPPSISLFFGSGGGGGGGCGCPCPVPPPIPICAPPPICAQPAPCPMTSYSPAYPSYPSYSSPSYALPPSYASLPAPSPFYQPGWSPAIPSYQSVPSYSTGYSVSPPTYVAPLQAPIYTSIPIPGPLPPSPLYMPVPPPLPLPVVTDGYEKISIVISTTSSYQQSGYAPAVKVYEKQFDEENSLESMTPASEPPIPIEIPKEVTALPLTLDYRTSQVVTPTQFYTPAYSPTTIYTEENASEEGPLVEKQGYWSKTPEISTKHSLLENRHNVLKRMKTETIHRTNNTCNSVKLANVMTRAIVEDVSVSKRMIQHATKLAFDGAKFDVFCATGEFSYSIHSRKYCEVTKEDVTCFAFR